MKIGLEYLPQPIKDYLRRSVGRRPQLPHIYHVTELIYCLRKAYWRRVNPDSDGFSLKSQWNIFRGKTFDHLWSPLFEYNQGTYVVHRGGVSIQGTFDFLLAHDGEIYLYDLKMPASVYYSKNRGASEHYKIQVKAYLALAHTNGKLHGVHKARVMMLAEDLVIDEVEEDDDVLGWLWERAFFLDHAITSHSLTNLPGPEYNWECNPDYCPASPEYRQGCKP